MKRGKLKTVSGFIQHCIQWARNCELGDVELTTHLQMPRLRWHGAVTPLPIQLHGVMLNYAGVNFLPLNSGLMVKVQATVCSGTGYVLNIGKA
jgi:hypothetical protein